MRRPNPSMRAGSIWVIGAACELARSRAALARSRSALILRREVTEADDKLKRLYRLIEEGVTALDDVLKDRLSNTPQGARGAITVQVELVNEPDGLCFDGVARKTQTPFSALWKVTRSTSPANTSWVDDCGCEVIGTIVWTTFARTYGCGTGYGLIGNPVKCLASPRSASGAQ